MTRPAATLTFAGAAGTVTGSKHLLECGKARILLDCGLFQGLKELRLRNWRPQPFDPRSVDAVVLSHAHLDHAGYLPVLVRQGFEGPVHCTAASGELLEVLLRDAARLQEEDAARANRYGYTRHRPALPLFTEADVERVLARVKRQPYGEWFRAAQGMAAQFHRAGHILGSAIVEVQLDEPRPTSLVFSGDLGRWDRPILRDPELVRAADVLLIESTNGDRLHATHTEDQLARIVNEVARRASVLLVPAFAIGRTQELIWTLRRLEDSGRVPALPVFVDSPMAINVTEIYCRHPDEHDLDMALLMDQKRCPLYCRQYHLVRTVQESKALNAFRGPLVIIAGSGMATGGRILHHFEQRLGDARNVVLLAGYQAAGTRGRLLQEGAPSVWLHGKEVAVRARIETLDGLSAHADRAELMRWLRGFERAPRHTYVVHGEPAASQALARTIVAELGWTASVAEDGARVAVATGESSGIRASS